MSFFFWVCCFGGEREKNWQNWAYRANRSPSNRLEHFPILVRFARESEIAKGRVLNSPLHDISPSLSLVAFFAAPSSS